MIGQLTGCIIEKHPPQLIIDVNGIGYEVSAPMSTFYTLINVDQKITLYTHLIVREDAHQLFGFIDKTERRLFRTLIKVSGIGPKVALAILSSVSPDNFVRSVMDNNSAALVKLPGIGKKTAQRLIIEMKDRLKDWSDDFVPTEVSLQDKSINDTSSALNEAIAALVALGYKRQEAHQAVQNIDSVSINSEDIIRSALKSIAEKK